MKSEEENNFRIFLNKYIPMYFESEKLLTLVEHQAIITAENSPARSQEIAKKLIEHMHKIIFDKELQ